MPEFSKKYHECLVYSGILGKVGFNSFDKLKNASVLSQTIKSIYNSEEHGSTFIDQITKIKDSDERKRPELVNAFRRLIVDLVSKDHTTCPSQMSKSSQKSKPYFGKLQKNIPSEKIDNLKLVAPKEQEKNTYISFVNILHVNRNNNSVEMNSDTQISLANKKTKAYHYPLSQSCEFERELTISRSFHRPSEY